MPELDQVPARARVDGEDDRIRGREAAERLDRRGQQQPGSSTSAGRCSVTRPYSPGSRPSSSHGSAARAASTCASTRVDHRVADEVAPARSIPSRSRLPSALSEWTSRTLADVVGEDAVVLLRHRAVVAAQPASRWATGMPSLTAASAPASVELTSPGRRRGRARRSSSTLSIPTSAFAVCSPCVPEPTPRKTSGFGRSSSRGRRRTCPRRSAGPCARARARLRASSPARGAPAPPS